MEKDELIKVAAPLYKQIIAGVVVAISFYVSWVGVSQLISTLCLFIMLIPFIVLITLNRRYRVILNDDYEIFEGTVEFGHKIMSKVYETDTPCFVCIRNIKENDEVYVVDDGRDLLIVGKVK